MLLVLLASIPVTGGGDDIEYLDISNADDIYTVLSGAGQNLNMGGKLIITGKSKRRISDKVKNNALRRAGFSPLSENEYIKNINIPPNTAVRYSNIELKRLIRDDKSLIRLKKDYPEDVKYFCIYIAKHFKSSDKNAAKSALKYFDLPDYDAYIKLRELFSGDIGDSYRYNILKKISTIKDILPKDYRFNTLLDIGTEDTETLDRIELTFDCEATGINLNDPDYSHYDYNFNEGVKQGSIKLYDGIHITDVVDKKYDVVTMIAVIHHIPDDVLIELAKEIYKVTNKYLIIKDNDLVDDLSRSFSRIQHDIYEGYIYPGRINYMNYEASRDKVINAFAGFNLVKEDRINNFSKAYWLLLEKK